MVVVSGGCVVATTEERGCGEATQAAAVAKPLEERLRELLAAAPIPSLTVGPLLNITRDGTASEKFELCKLVSAICRAEQSGQGWNLRLKQQFK